MKGDDWREMGLMRVSCQSSQVVGESFFIEAVISLHIFTLLDGETTTPSLLCSIMCCTYSKKSAEKSHVPSAASGASRANAFTIIAHRSLACSPSTNQFVPKRPRSMPKYSQISASTQ